MLRNLDGRRSAPLLGKNARTLVPAIRGGKAFERGGAVAPAHACVPGTTAPTIIGEDKRDVQIPPNTHRSFDRNPPPDLAERADSGSSFPLAPASAWIRPRAAVSVDSRSMRMKAPVSRFAL